MTGAHTEHAPEHVHKHTHTNLFSPIKSKELQLYSLLSHKTSSDSVVMPHEGMVVIFYWLVMGNERIQT